MELDQPNADSAAGAVRRHRLGLLVPLVLSLRPWQWMKNGVVLLPLVFSVNTVWRPGDVAHAAGLFQTALAGFAVFCLVSGAVYLVNDVADREGDRAHARRSRRPVASGALSARAALIAAALLMAAGGAWSVLLDAAFALNIAVYAALNLGYSLGLKRVVLLDVMIVAGGYVLRMVAGSVLLGVPTSPWLYMTLGLGALFMVLGKRESETLLAGEGAPRQRAVLGSYSSDLLRLLLGITATGTLLAYGLYIFTSETMPANESMFLTLPLVIFGLFRYLYLIEVEEGAESPELIILKDRPMVLAILSWAIAGVVILLLDR